MSMAIEQTLRGAVPHHRMFIFPNFKVKILRNSYSKFLVSVTLFIKCTECVLNPNQLVVLLFEMGFHNVV